MEMSSTVSKEELPREIVKEIAQYALNYPHVMFILFCDHHFIRSDVDFDAIVTDLIKMSTPYVSCNVTFVQKQYNYNLTSTYYIVVHNNKLVLAFDWRTMKTWTDLDHECQQKYHIHFAQGKTLDEFDAEMYYDPFTAKILDAINDFNECHNPNENVVNSE